MSAPSPLQSTNADAAANTHTRTQIRTRTTSPPYTTYTDLWETLERNGLAVISVETVAGDPYVRISEADIADPRLVTVLTTAIVARGSPDLVTDAFQIQLVSEIGGERIGYCYVSSEWIHEFHDGELTALEYARRVLETYRPYNDQDQNQAQNRGGDPR